MSGPNLAIYSMVLGFQRRYWWQLSSLAQQTAEGDRPVPNIRAVADVSRRDPHWAWNEQLAKTFSTRIDFSQIEWDAEDERYGRRGHIRSADLKHALDDGWADWILFNDCDMVYEPRYFSRLMQLVQGLEDEHRVFATHRHSMAFEDGYSLINSFNYQGEVPAAFGRASTLTTWPAARGRISGAGFFQLISVRALRRLIEKDPGYLDYVPDNWNRDHNTFERNHITHSDRKFRSRLGGIYPLPECLTQLHLNHYRKNDEEYPHGECH